MHSVWISHFAKQNDFLHHRSKKIKINFYFPFSLDAVILNYSRITRKTQCAGQRAPKRKRTNVFFKNPRFLNSSDMGKLQFPRPPSYFVARTRLTVLLQAKKTQCAGRVRAPK